MAGDSPGGPESGRPWRSPSCLLSCPDDGVRGGSCLDVGDHGPTGARRQGCAGHRGSGGGLAPKTGGLAHGWALEPSLGEAVWIEMVRVWVPWV